MIDRCRLCGGAELRFFNALGNRGEFKYYRCQECWLVNYDLATGLDQKKYAASFIDPRDSNNPQNRHQTSTYRHLRRLLSRGARVLEIGCGNGRLLYLAARDGMDVMGLELSGFLAAAVRRELGIPVLVADFLSFDPQDAGQYDAVVLRHVLEHLPQPVPAMARISHLLKPGGLALIEIPNIDGWELGLRRFLKRSGVYRKRYASDFVPGHCNEYCRASFRRLLHLSQLDLESWQTYSYRPFMNLIYRILPFGTKARAIIRKPTEQQAVLRPDWGGKLRLDPGAACV